MKIIVHIREKTVAVQCGDGPQRLRWLADVAISRYDSSHGADIGAPKGMYDRQGNAFDMESIVKDVLTEEEHVYVILKDEELEVADDDDA